jgi:hypothetical protein
VGRRMTNEVKGKKKITAKRKTVELNKGRKMH